MNYGYLNKYFKGIGGKRLSDVEISPDVSNQHEFNGIADFKNIFGSERINFKGRFIFLSDTEEATIQDKGTLTWYDARENHPTRTEYRLYYSDNTIMDLASAGDLIVICKRSDDELIIIVTPKGSTSEQQILWLFGLGQLGSRFVVKDFSGLKKEIGFAGKHIMGLLGIEVDEIMPHYLDELIAKFGKHFPETKQFSEYARSTVRDVSAIESPDHAIMAWLEKEEILFRTLEKAIVQDKLISGFGEEGTDVDDFINFSLSVQNRRKSRAGHAFEHHLSKVFDAHQVRYHKGARTERNNRPDFLFPGIREYQSTTYDDQRLLMLGVKTSVKDRWRQVLAEADRITTKHLITLQPAISVNQTDEMKAQSLQLVIPAPLFPTFSTNQQMDLLTVNDFIEIAKSKQTNQWQMSMNLK